MEFQIDALPRGGLMAKDESERHDKWFEDELAKELED